MCLGVLSMPRQAGLNFINCRATYVYSDPPAFEPVCGVDSRPASAKRIQNDIAGITARFNNPLQQLNWLLRFVTQPLLLSGGTYVNDNILNWVPFSH